MNQTEYRTSKCLDTLYHGKKYFSEQQRLVLVVLTSTLICLIVVTNSLVILTLFKTKQLYNVSLRLLLLLSLSDCLFALFGGVPYVIMLSRFHDKTYCGIEVVTKFFMMLFGKLSAYILVVIATDRYARVKYLNRYSQVVTNRRFYIGFSLLLLVTITIPAFEVLAEMNQLKGNKLPGKAVQLLIDICMFLVGVTTYVMAIYTTKKHQRNASTLATVTDLKSSFLRLAKLLIITAFVFYVPYMLVNLTKALYVRKLRGDARRWLYFAMFLCYALLFCNSFANALIFLCVNKKAKRFLRRQYDTSSDSMENLETRYRPAVLSW